MALHVAIKVHGENRVKDNEVVFIRPSTANVCAYCPATKRMDDRFVLIKEYRTSAMNESGFVFELPGGSSFKADIDPLTVAMKELAEETGIELTRDRFQVIGKRQNAATIVANQTMLFSVWLTPQEMDSIAARQGEVHGLSVEAERTYLHVFTRRQLLHSNWADYVTLGQISLIGSDDCT